MLYSKFESILPCDTASFQALKKKCGGGKQVIAALCLSNLERQSVKLALPLYKGEHKRDSFQKPLTPNTNNTVEREDDTHTI